MIASPCPILLLLVVTGQGGWLLLKTVCECMFVCVCVLLLCRGVFKHTIDLPGNYCQSVLSARLLSPVNKNILVGTTRNSLEPSPGREPFTRNSDIPKRKRVAFQSCGIKSPVI